MRVIAGTAKGTRLVAPRGGATRPTADRVREAVFSSLQPRLGGAHVLDLFAGSGALAIESLSRGAQRAVLVERSRPALAAIRRNLDAARIADRASVVAGELPVALRRVDGPFDLVFADPPYDFAPVRLAAVLEAVVDLLAPDAQVRVETSSRAPAPVWPPGCRAGRVRRYGDTTVHEASAGGRDTTSA
jgi:16S rRNA (guanine966-N2)-methyltransferase